MIYTIKYEKNGIETTQEYEWTEEKTWIEIKQITDTLDFDNILFQGYIDNEDQI
jgi:hypothetical protein